MNVKKTIGEVKTVVHTNKKQNDNGRPCKTDQSCPLWLSANKKIF